MIYDDKFADKIASPELFNEKLKIWESATKHLTNEQMRKALNLATIKCAWPPSIAEFLDFATDQINPERDFHEAYIENPILKALPAPRNLELAQKSIRHLRFVVGMMK